MKNQKGFVVISAALYALIAFGVWTGASKVDKAMQKPVPHSCTLYFPTEKGFVKDSKPEYCKLKRIDINESKQQQPIQTSQAKQSQP